MTFLKFVPILERDQFLYQLPMSLLRVSDNDNSTSSDLSEDEFLNVKGLLYVQCNFSLPYFTNKDSRKSVLK